MNVTDIERGDTVRIESNEYKYDGHEGTVMQVYGEYAVLKLHNADGVTIAAPWAYIATDDE